MFNRKGIEFNKIEFQIKNKFKKYKLERKKISKKILSNRNKQKEIK